MSNMRTVCYKHGKNYEKSITVEKKRISQDSHLIKRHVIVNVDHAGIKNCELCCARLLTASTWSVRSENTSLFSKSSRLIENSLINIRGFEWRDKELRMNTSVSSLLEKHVAETEAFSRP